VDLGRKFLPHTPPPGLIPDLSGEVYFITVCTEPRGENQLASPETWQALRETALRRESLGYWQVRLLLAMPDHWHALCSFSGTKPMTKVITDLKSWLAKTQQIRWQRDFFDHRLRTWESADEKRSYILANPVRAKLIEEGQIWPYVFDARMEDR
jgi:putative transposase